MSDARSNWSSKIGFILAATGSAVGLGAIWKFPYMAGANGGSAFILPFIAMVLFFGVILIMAEMIIGRAGRGSVVTSFKRIAGKAWIPLGFIGVLTAFVIMTYYSTVGGWCLTYLFEAIRGNAASSDLALLEKTFKLTVSSPVSAIVYQTGFLAITAGVLIFGVNKGIERISKILMPLLFVLMVVLIIRGLTLPGAMEGLKFLFSPRWDQVTANSLLNAMGFTFFSLSVGMGIMITYGSYIHHSEDIPSSAIWVAVLAFISSILAGLMVIPPVIAFGLNPSAGPGLTFITMPAVFSHIPLGNVFAVCFYSCLLVAALTSMISLFEVPLAYLMDEWNFSRKGASLALFIALTICSIPAALSMGPWSDYTILGKNIFDATDYLACNILMPLSAIFVIALTGWFFFDKTSYELNVNKKRSPGYMKFVRFMLAFVAPCFIAVVAISNFL
ncbi:sodium-dependent transporter [uncultured Parasutterella sp.]|uniref:sodium-dependent transporter n=2 Tax=uncultured Parasutterella sp. TaxID=1263098 RepID=UPI0025B6CFBC|nr:sodium-dependent transporter [uncultured Parasutterella sp.]